MVLKFQKIDFIIQKYLMFQFILVQILNFKMPKYLLNLLIILNLRLIINFIYLFFIQSIINFHNIIKFLMYDRLCIMAIFQLHTLYINLILHVYISCSKYLKLFQHSILFEKDLLPIHYKGEALFKTSNQSCFLFISSSDFSL